MDNLMNNVMYRDACDALSNHIADIISAEKYFSGMELADLCECDAYAVIDKLILKWITERLEAEDVAAQLKGRSIDEICEDRSKLHFGAAFSTQYSMLYNAFTVISAAHYSCPSLLDGMVVQYRESDYRIDQAIAASIFHLTRFQKMTDMNGCVSL
jgi:hypothetical protein